MGVARYIYIYIYHCALSKKHTRTKINEVGRTKSK